MAMLNPRRSVLLACAVLAIFLLLRSTHKSEPLKPISKISPLPTGSYEESRVPLENSYQRPAVQNSDKDKSDASPHAVTQQPLLKKQRPQIPIDDLKTQPLRKQLSYIFPYDREAKFPAYIWQTWKYSPADGNFDEEFRPLEASWTVLHPTFIHEVITDSVAAHLVRHLYASIPEVYQAYSAMPKAVLKADFFRYLILLARGGIYSDIDTEALKSAVEWVPDDTPRSSYGLVVGIEADPDRPDWQAWYSRRIQFCQWTIQSKPGHPVLVDLVATITEETLRRKASGELAGKDLSDVIEFTGPAVWTDALFAFFNNADYFDMATSKGNITWRHFTGIERAKKVGDVVVLPITSFSPGVGQMGAKNEDDPMAFVKHRFEGTWKPENERHVTGNDPKGKWN